jgi:hypothetical protein
MRAPGWIRCAARRVLRGISYDIKPQEKVDHPQSYALNKELVRSSMSVEFKGLTDLEMRDFIKKMQNDFSGLIVVEKVEFEPKDELNCDQPAQAQPAGAGRFHHRHGQFLLVQHHRQGGQSDLAASPSLRRIES